MTGLVKGVGSLCSGGSGVVGGVSGFMWRGVVAVWVGGWVVGCGSRLDGVARTGADKWFSRGVVWLAGDGLQALDCMRLSCVVVGVCEARHARRRRVGRGLRSEIGCVRVVLLVRRCGEGAWLWCVWCCVAGLVCFGGGSPVGGEGFASLRVWVVGVSLLMCSSLSVCWV
jgi:hypothetical protein